jgi:hypothetical protein
VSLKGVKPLLAASPQEYYDSPNQAVSSTLTSYLDPVTVNFSTSLAIALTASPGTLNFACLAGGSNPLAQTLAIGATGGTLDNWSTGNTQRWLSATATGSAAGSLQVSVNCAGLTPGSYVDTIQVVSNTWGVGNSPLSVPVNLTVRSVIGGVVQGPAAVSAVARH